MDRKMKIINLTPHVCHICNDAGEIVRSIEPTTPSARVSSTVSVVGSVDGIPVTNTAFGAVDNLPAPADDTVYIVNLLVQQAARHRTDLYRPDTGPQNVVRDAAGQIIGVKALSGN
jgi:hypothetical protein